ncbi:hypothetical protein AcW1_009486 [Taiwanofungus camphoratus]|nr:hypothetical protein AcW1_009486 [Antrodia cinnamomea]
MSAPMDRAMSRGGKCVKLYTKCHDQVLPPLRLMGCCELYPHYFDEIMHFVTYTVNFIWTLEGMSQAQQVNPFCDHRLSQVLAFQTVLHHSPSQHLFALTTTTRLSFRIGALLILCTFGAEFASGKNN